MACRSLERCDQARKDVSERLSGNANLQMLKLDLASFKSIREFVTEFLSRKTNVLVSDLIDLLMVH